MEQVIEQDNRFVIDLLTTLRNEKFSPLAWARFLWRAWQMSYHTARENPALTCSWLRITSVIGFLTIATCNASFLLEGSISVLHLLPGFLFCVVWQQSDLFWHLGLNRQAQTGKLLPVVGLANTFTWLRAFGASFLLGRIVGGLSTPSWLALVVFVSGVTTDILDGLIARTTQTQSKLGQIGDGESDFCLYSAIALILIQNAVLPLWLGLVMLLRFFVPLLAALVSYFLFAHPVRFGSTLWGKYAGLAQCLYFLVLLAPAPLFFATRYIQFPLLLATLLLLTIAPAAQIITNVRTSR